MRAIKSKILYEKDHDYRVVVNLYGNGSIKIEVEYFDDGTFQPEPGWYPAEDIFIPTEKIVSFYYIIRDFVKEIFPDEV